MILSNLSLDIGNETYNGKFGKFVWKIETRKIPEFDKDEIKKDSDEQSNNNKFKIPLIVGVITGVVLMLLFRDSVPQTNWNDFVNRILPSGMVNINSIK